MYCTWRVLSVGLEISISLWNSWGNTASKYDDLFFWILLILSQNWLHFNRYDNGIFQWIKGWPYICFSLPQISSFIIKITIFLMYVLGIYLNSILFKEFDLLPPLFFSALSFSCYTDYRNSTIDIKCIIEKTLVYWIVDRKTFRSVVSIFFQLRTKRANNFTDKDTVAQRG